MNTERLQAFFLLAMRSGGFAVGSKYEPVETGVGIQKRWTFEGTGEFAGLKLVDQYLVHPMTKKSTGYTEIIGPGSELMWLMTYNGIYDKDAIPFLKKALLAAEGEFVGGRGPISFREGDLVYSDIVNSFGNMFEAFLGYEEVRRAGYLLGRHHYSGYLLSA